MRSASYRGICSSAPAVPGDGRDTLACAASRQQAVLCAVELALEAGVPTKVHVLNILHRLTDGKAPPVAPIDAPQALRLAQEPRADVDRYDNLRELRHAS